MEYGTDTTRAIMGVAFSGDAARFPDIRFIWSHAGGTVPFLAGRIDGASRNAKDRAARTASSHELKKFYYDLAGAANPGAVASLLQLVTTAQVLFGTDFPSRRHQPGRRQSRRRARAVQRERPARDRSRQRGEASAAAQELSATVLSGHLTPHRRSKRAHD